MEVKKLAIVGLGSIGRRHLKLIKEIRPELDVILVFSLRLYFTEVRLGHSF